MWLFASSSSSLINWIIWFSVLFIGLPWSVNYWMVCWIHFILPYCSFCDTSFCSWIMPVLSLCSSFWVWIRFTMIWIYSSRFKSVTKLLFILLNIFYFRNNFGKIKEEMINSKYNKSYAIPDIWSLNIQLGVLYEKSNYETRIFQGTEWQVMPVNVTKHQIICSPNGDRNRRNSSDI